MHPCGGAAEVKHTGLHSPNFSTTWEPANNVPLKLPAEWSSPSRDAPPMDSFDKHTVWVSCRQSRFCLEQRVPQLGSMQFSGRSSPNKPGHGSGSPEPRQVCEILGQLLSAPSLSFFTCKMGPARPTSEGGTECLLPSLIWELFKNANWVSTHPCPCPRPGLECAWQVLSM